jgi:hypothetical protein
MEALTTLAEMSTGRKKVSAAAASAMGAWGLEGMTSGDYLNDSYNYLFLKSV